MVIEHFKKICTIPHCSGDTSKLHRYITDIAKKNGYHVVTDGSKNIVCYKEKRVLALQCHYDMVCIGDAPDISLIEEKNILKAKNSSLGADNGIGIAMMLTLIEEGVELEYVFSADEEIGLIGAKAFDIELQAKYMINIDSETEGDVYIGCAGGVDIPASIVIDFEDAPKDLDWFEVSVDGLPGGHSGIDIDKNIPNAIKILASWLHEHRANLAHIEGGERRNSIARHAKAVVALDRNSDIKKFDNVTIEKISAHNRYLLQSETIINMLHSFQHGVRDFNNELNVVHSSINLAQIFTKNGSIDIILTARSMDDTSLKNLAYETENFLAHYHFTSKQEEYYPAWKPEINSFSENILSIMKKSFESAELKAMHAGLECAIFKDKFPAMQIVSIGPNIFFPHSDSEYVELNSVKKVYKSLKEIIAHFQTLQ